ncbi:MAG: peroxiredoxin [Thermoplasmata archaeon]|nr:peroxiredoxin [Thermoplasmata archaeon]MCI4359092.1 peroxiredoxin [Thermoplasmata archaeon]
MASAGEDPAVLEVGQPAVDFEAPVSSGGRVRLSDWRGHPVVLFFFPKANTTGCARETRGFALLFPELDARGVRVLGISVDRIGTQTGFAHDCGAGFPMAADADKKIATAFGVLGFLGYAKRVTFFIGPDGTIVDRVASGLPGPHVTRAKQRYLSVP